MTEQVPSNYRVEPTRCGCHPETCACPDYTVWHGDSIAAKGMRKDQLESLVAAANRGLVHEPCPALRECGGAWMIVYDDLSVKPETFSGEGAEAAAKRRFQQISSQWNAHLFARVGVNSRDALPPEVAQCPTCLEAHELLTRALIAADNNADGDLLDKVHDAIEVMERAAQPPGVTLTSQERHALIIGAQEASDPTCCKLLLELHDRTSPTKGDSQ